MTPGEMAAELERVQSQVREWRANARVALRGAGSPYEDHPDPVFALAMMATYWENRADALAAKAERSQAELAAIHTALARHADPDACAADRCGCRAATPGVLVAGLLAAIRKHRDQRGDDRCHLDDGELYAVLPEGDTRPPQDTAVTLENCERFIRCRQQGREYVSPEREIERLRAALKPFADAAAWYEKLLADPPWEDPDIVHQPPGEGDGVPVGYPHCKRAREVLGE